MTPRRVRSAFPSPLESASWRGSRGVTTVLIVVAVLAGAPPALHAQTSGLEASAPNHIFVEVGGSTLLPSLNYERTLWRTWLVRLGGYYVPLDGETLGAVAGGFGKILGHGSHHVELGSGLQWAFDELGTMFSTITTAAVYRYQAPAGHFVFRAGMTPFYLLHRRQDGNFGFPHAGRVYLWAGVSIGYSW